MSAAARDRLAAHALAWIPKILTLQDRNPHSPTYGCFDRNFWHYKIIDFPSGMAQEFVWPLALAYALELPNNPYRGNAAVREWVEAGIGYAARSAHRDGSCDDYFPYERAAGAAVFSLLACVESYRLLGLHDEALLRFFERRADWLARHEESGRLANHLALTVLALTVLGELLGTGRWSAARERRLARLLAWQSSEGWFPEYEGFDPGYHTLTVSCLARILEQQPDDDRVRGALERAVRLCALVQHPDGSFGGEYGSRNTYNYFPHGFELVGRWMPDALRINDLFLAGLACGRVPAYDDDHLVAHHAWNYLLAWRDYVDERPAPAPRPAGRVVLREAGLVIDRRRDTELFLATGKAGVFKLFRGGRLAASDTHVSLLVRSGRRTRNAVAHLNGAHDARLEADALVVQGRLAWAKHTQMTPPNLVLLRAAMLGGGRLFPDLVRRMLQQLLITGRAEAPFRFRRSLRWQDGAWEVTDEVWADDWSQVVAAGIGAHQTSIYVVMSRVFAPGQLHSAWLDLSDRVRRLRPGEPLVVRRTL
jgi:hypothetical protein